MGNGLLHLHNIMRWIILIVLLWSIVVAFTGWQQKRVFSPNDKRAWLFTLIFSHINLLIGLYLLFFGRYGIVTTKLPEGTSVMKNSFFRFFWVEHPTLMIISVILVTIAHGKAKKAIPDASKFKGAFWLFFIALVLILLSIPWPWREIGRPLFPGM